MKTAIIPIIDPGETKTVTFAIGALVPFGEQTTVRVDVDPVRVRRTRPTTRTSTPSSSRCSRVARGRDSSLCGGRDRARRRRSCCGAEPLGIAAQSVVLGEASGDLLEFAVSLQGRIDDLHRAVDEVAAGLSRVDRGVGGAVTNTAVALRRIRGDGRAAIGLRRAARRHAHRHRRHGDPGRPMHLREGLRPGPFVGRALARGAGVRRPRDGALRQLYAAATAA